MDPKPKQMTGHGPPRRTLKAPIGEKYLDETSGRRWFMTSHGWELPSSLNFDVLTSDKSRWVRAANQDGQRLEDWVVKKLNDAVRNPPMFE